MDDCLIVGGGVIGLSLAYELAGHGLRIRIVERGEIGQEASWAGAGILPPRVMETAEHPYDKLHALSFQLHATLAARLRDETGINTGYHRCGGIYVARRPGEAASLTAYALDLEQLGVEAKRLTRQELAEIEPGLRPASNTEHFSAAVLVPAECQLRNPRHMQALAKACAQRGVHFETGTTVHSIQRKDNQIDCIETSRGPLRASTYCLCGGAWTAQLLQPLGVAADVYPVRGQIVLLKCNSPPFRHVINEGPRYLVPRDDGRVLAGSTEEECGFDKRNTDEAIDDLTSFARSLVPALNSAIIEKTWAGLRPASYDGFPYLGTIPNLRNAYVAAGHFRSGLLLSTGTARVMGQLIRGEKPEIDLAAFSVGRT